jgi:hypothetical protein
MQINGSSSFSYRPTQLPVQPGLSPEERNNKQDAVQDAQATRQAAVEDQKTAQRTAVVNYSAAQSQKDNVDLYISLSSGSDVNSNSGASVRDLREVQQRQQLAQTTQTLDTLEKSKTNPLQQRIDGMVGVSNQQGSLFSAQA